MLDLACARTGTPVDMDCVQIHDQGEFGKINQLFMELSARALSERRPLLERDVALDGFAQDDGTLHVHCGHTRGGPQRVAIIAAGKWRLLSPDDVAQISAEAKGAPIDHEALIGQMSLMLQGAAQGIETQRRQRESVMSSASQILVIADRSPNSLSFLDAALEGAAAVRGKVDEWLRGPDEYAVVSRGPEPSSNWLVSTSSMTPLVDETLPELATLVDDIGKTYLFADLLADGDLKKRLELAWAAQGGGAARAGPSVDGRSPRARAKSVDPVLDRMIQSQVFVTDGSGSGRETMMALLKHEGRSDPEISAQLKRWLESKKKFMVYVPQHTPSVAFAGSAAELTSYLRDAMHISRGLYIGRAVTDENLSELEAATRLLSAEVVKEFVGDDAPVAPAWLGGRFPGVTVQVRRGPKGTMTFVELGAEAIEQMQVDGVVALFTAMVADGAALRASHKSIVLWTAAYDEDVRTLDDIPALRAFARAVTDRCPWWLHMLNNDGSDVDSTFWWSLALAEKPEPNRYSSDGNAQISFSTPSLSSVYQASLSACESLYREAAATGLLSTSEAGRMLESVATGLVWTTRQVFGVPASA